MFARLPRNCHFSTDIHLFYADIGQVEGAIVMGLGYWLTEEIKYDEENGANGYYSTWKYKPPWPRTFPSTSGSSCCITPPILWELCVANVRKFPMSFGTSVTGLNTIVFLSGANVLTLAIKKCVLKYR